MKYVILFIVSLLLVGCGSTPPREIVKEESVRVVTIPESLLTQCKVTEPIKPDDFIILSADKKEEVLVDLNITLYRDLKICNNKLTEIKNFQDRQVLILKESNK